jgi:hypothetical protein
MRKHEISYHEHSDDIFFLSDYCKHLRAFERLFSKLSIQIKEMMQEIRQEKNEFKLTRILKRNENIEFSLFMKQRNQEMIDNSETKKLIEIRIEIKDSTEFVVSLKKKKRKRKKSKMIKSIRNESTDSEIYMIEAASFHLLIKQK